MNISFFSTIYELVVNIIIIGIQISVKMVSQSVIIFCKHIRINDFFSSLPLK